MSRHRKRRRSFASRLVRALRREQRGYGGDSHSLLIRATLDHVINAVRRARR